MTILTDSPLLLAEEGRPVVRIIAPANASAPEEYAEEELRRHLHEMAGAGPCLRTTDRSRGAATGIIYLNNREAAEAAGVVIPALGPEAFHLETRGGNLFLLGGSPRGLLYGVYDLLESLGCRWFTPEVARIPRQRRIVLEPVRKTAAPAFEFRDMWNWDMHDPVWWVRNKMNGWYTPVPEYMGGHVDYGLFVHTFFTLLPPEEYFADHPEYFSEIAGVRRHETGQLCLTNPDVLRLLTTRLLDRMRKNPRATIFSVSQNDCEGYCECPRCRAVAEEEGSQAGPIIRFVNAVAEATSREFPDKLIDTLAYWYSLDAPKTTPHPNVRVRLCPIRCCQGHPFGTCDHPESARFLQALERWAKLTPQMYIWHYCTDFAHYPLPMPNFDELHANINLYKKFGVYGIFMQGMGEEGGGAESMALRGYVLSRLLWNPDQPVWPIIDEFLAGYYGAAAPKVRFYLDTFHQRVREDRSLHPSLYDPPTSPLYDEETMAPTDTALAEGEAQVTGVRRLRVRLLRHGLTYIRLNRISGEFRRDGDLFHGDATDDDCRAFEAMVRDWKRFGVLHINEGSALTASLDKLRNRLSEHPVEWLREGEQAVAVVPTLGGRLLEWHACGQQWLAPPDPDNHWQLYPMSEGYAESAIPGMYSYFGWGDRYRCRRADDGLHLSVDLAGDLRLSRTYALRDGVLHIDSRLENRGTAHTRTAWGGGIHFAIPAPVQVSYLASGHQQALGWDDLPDGLGAAKILEGAHLPEGAWQVTLPGFRITHNFTGPFTRAIIGKVAVRNTLALDLRTDALLLDPGATIEVSQRIAVERTGD